MGFYIKSMAQTIRYIQSIFAMFFITIHEGYSQDLKKEYYQCAIESYDSGKYSLAVDYFTRVIDLFPEDSLAYFDRAMAKEMLEDYQGAIEDYSKQITIDAKNVDCYFLRGILKYKLQKYQSCIEDCIITLSIEPDNSDAYYYIALSEFELEQYQKSINACDKAIGYNAKDNKYFLQRAEANLKLNRRKNACADYIQYKKMGGQSNQLDGICK